MIRKALIKDYAPKIVALILALIVWVQVFNDKNPLERRVFSAQVFPEGVENEIIIVSVDPARVNVAVEGRARTLDEIDKENLKAIARFSEVKEGVYPVGLSVDIPYGAKVVEISPTEVNVEIDVFSAAKVGVDVQVQGEPHEDFEVGELVPLTGSVRVTGPKRLVDKVKYVQGYVDIAGAAQTKNVMTTLSARDSVGDEVFGVDLEPKEIEVSIPLISLPPSKLVPVQAVITGTPAPGFAVGPVKVNPAQIKIRAEQELLDSLEHISTKPIDVSGKDSTFLHQAILDLTDEILVQDGRVLTTVEIVEDIQTKTYEDVIVQLEFPPVGYEWNIKPTMVDVDLTGRSDILEKIEKDDIVVYIDAQGRTEGTTDLVVAYEIKTPKEVDKNTLQANIKPPRVKLTLTTR